jgi:hypothetical protein
MSNGRRSILALGAMSVLALPGCVSQQSATLSPGTDLSNIRRVHVVRLAADTRGVQTIIADELRRMGRVATVGSESDVPSDADAVLTYADRWMWDITMYMISLDITVRTPGTLFPIASGRALRSSLVRQSPEEMVRDVLGRIFNQRPSS